MTLSTLTSITGYLIAEGSKATPGLFNRPLQALADNVGQINTSAESLLGWNKGSITTTLDTSNGTLSVLTIGAASGNTVTLPHHLALGNKRIENVAEPSNTSDAATKHYADAVLSGGAPSFRGSWFVHSAGVSIATRGLVYIASTNSLALADSNHSTSCPVGGVFIALATGTAPSNVTCGLVGEVGGFSSLVTGAVYFVSTTAGGITATAPSGTSDVVLVVGIAKSNVSLLFRPQYVSSHSTG